MVVFLQLIEFAFEDGMITDQEKTIIDIVSRTFNISKKEYDNAIAFMIGRSYDEISSDCVLIIESDDPNHSGVKLYKNYEEWRHIRIKGFKGHLVILHIESTGTLLFTYDGPLVLYFKGRDIIACRPYILERGVNIKGQGIEPIYYSKIFKKFVSRKFPAAMMALRLSMASRIRVKADPDSHVRRVVSSNFNASPIFSK